MPTAARSCTPTINVIVMAGLASTRATVTCTRRRPDPRITGDTDDAHTIGENAATRYSIEDRRNSTTVVTIRPIIPKSKASGPRNVVASPPDDTIVAARPSSTCCAWGRPACQATSAIASPPWIITSITTTVIPVAKSAFGPSFSASTISSGRPPKPAWMAEASIIAMVMPTAIPASGRMRPSVNQASVSLGVVDVSSTPHTHSMSSSRPLANQV